MSLKLYDDTQVKAVADAIRTKNGDSSVRYKLSEMPAAIEALADKDYLGEFTAEQGILTMTVQYTQARWTKRVLYAKLKNNQKTVVGIYRTDEKGATEFYSSSGITIKSSSSTYSFITETHQDNDPDMTITWNIGDSADTDYYSGTWKVYLVV